MARTLVNITTSWVNTFTGPAVVTVEKLGDGILLLNDAASDTAALAINPDDGARTQIDQRSAVDTYMKATGAGWQVTVDTGA